MKLRRGSIDLLRPKENNYDVEAYLAEREKDPDLRVAEFGHGIKPLALYDESFTGSRSYVGIEAWLRHEDWKGREGGAKKIFLEKVADKIPVGHKIIFLEIDTGNESEKYESDGQRLRGERPYRGEYNPRTALEDNSIDEVFVGNVFNDPDLANSRRRSVTLLKELARVTKPLGVIVIRDTTSPKYFSLTPAQIDAAGLEVKEVVLREDLQAWKMLEEVYGKSNVLPAKKGFYLFLQKKSRN